MIINSYNILILLGIIAIIVELLLGAATGFDLLVIGLASILGGLVGQLTNSFMISLSTTSVLLLIYLIVGRKMIKQKLFIVTKKTNVDGIIGKTAIVVKSIEPHKPGQVKVDGEIWRAESDKIFLVEEKCIIQSVSGVTLFVESKKE